ncbi:MAG: hypothetical protein ACOC0N_07010 [Chroococcales cyanobacterium]
MASQLTRILLPIWQYLNQPLFTSNHKVAFKPHRFWYLYRIQLLERCLSKDSESKSQHHPQ